MKYLPLNDLARLDYGRLLWKNPRLRARLLVHWTDARHPHQRRFQAARSLVETVLSAPVEELDAVCSRHGTSIRAALREIPPVFGQFWPDSQPAASDA